MPIAWRWAAVVVVAACLDPTEIVVNITTDVSCASLAGTSIRLGADPTAPPSAFQPTCDQDGTIGSIVVVPGAASRGSLIQVTTGVGKTPDACERDGYKGGCIVARRALGFVSHDSLSLPIRMQKSCVDVSCDSATTCVNGGCQPIDHVDYDAGAPDTSAPDAAPPVVVEFVAANGSSVSVGGQLDLSPTVTVVPGEAVVVALQGPSNMVVTANESGWVETPVVTSLSSASFWVRAAGASEPTSYSFKAVGPTGFVDGVIGVYRNVGSALSSQGVGFVGPTMQFTPNPVNRPGSMVVAVFGTLSASGWNVTLPAIKRWDGGSHALVLADLSVLTAPQSPVLAAAYEMSGAATGWAAGVTLTPP